MKDNRGFIYMCLLLVLSALFTCTRYIAVALLAAGSMADSGIYSVAQERVGPFLPAMSTICLFGGLLFAVVELINVLRSRKK